MPIDYKFEKWVSDPIIQWRSFLMAWPSYNGTSTCYDGKRYMYAVVQYGSTGTSASTTVLFQYDTWLDSEWCPLATTTSWNRGIDIEYDDTRKLIILIHGAGLTSWQVFNLNTTSVVFCNVTCAARALTTITPVLPATADYGANIVMPEDVSMRDSAGNTLPLDEGTIDIGSTATSIIDSLATKDLDIYPNGTYTDGLVGCMVEFTSGILSGQRQLITARTNGKQLVTNAFTSAPAPGDVYKIVLPKMPVTSGTATWFSTGISGMVANKYANSDAVIVSGLGVGQRRRIASHTTAWVFTLATAVTGNPRTGNWATTPDGTSVIEIVPSSDFIYYIPGTTANVIHSIDVVQTTGTAWSANLWAMPLAPGGGALVFHTRALDPFSLYILRGNAGNTLYRFNIGTLARDTITTYWGSETITTGSSATFLHGRRKIFIQKEGQKRTWQLDLVDGILKPWISVPYVSPWLYDGKRLKFVQAPNGSEWIYIIRAWGQETFRVPLEWLPQ